MVLQIVDCDYLHPFAKKGPTIATGNPSIAGSLQVRNETINSHRFHVWTRPCDSQCDPVSAYKIKLFLLLVVRHLLLLAWHLLLLVRHLFLVSCPIDSLIFKYLTSPTRVRADHMSHGPHRLACFN